MTAFSTVNKLREIVKRVPKAQCCLMLLNGWLRIDERIIYMMIFAQEHRESVPSVCVYN